MKAKTRAKKIWFASFRQAFQQTYPGFDPSPYKTWGEAIAAAQAQKEKEDGESS